MACSSGYVKTGASTPDIHTCVSVSGSNVNVSLEGVTTERWPFVGYVKFKLQRAGANEVWLDVSTQNGGYWSDSSTTKKNFIFNNIGYAGQVMLVTAEFYANSSYTDKLISSASHMFVR
ncbi:hypothetical protein MHH81_21170 [Psychrobacillus sp. FSL H8-0484]|uniref:hypothetical protein n=1 Tax=Psychrobacillus sp. FSL H8-0484 TaxID=2921390 RepID=UPI0030F62E28